MKLISILFFLLLWIFATGLFGQENHSEHNIDLLIIVDDSQSMVENDTANNRIKSVEFARNFLKEYKKPGVQYRLGVIRFANDVILSIPLTSVDSLTSLDINKILKVKNSEFTAFEDAFDLAYKEFNKNNSFEGKHNPQILLLTDGILKGSMNREQIRRYNNEEGYKREIHIKSDMLRKNGCVINEIIFNKNNDDIAFWQSMVQRTDGLFYSLSDNISITNLKSIYNRILIRSCDLLKFKITFANDVLKSNEKLSFTAQLLLRGEKYDDSLSQLVTHIIGPLDYDTTIYFTPKSGKYNFKSITFPNDGLYKFDISAMENGKIFNNDKIVYSVDTPSSWLLNCLSIILICLLALFIIGFVFYTNKIKKDNNSLLIAEQDRIKKDYDSLLIAEQDRIKKDYDSLLADEQDRIRKNYDSLLEAERYRSKAIELLKEEKNEEAEKNYKLALNSVYEYSEKTGEKSAKEFEGIIDEMLNELYKDSSSAQRSFLNEVIIKDLDDKKIKSVARILKKRWTEKPNLIFDELYDTLSKANGLNIIMELQRIETGSELKSEKVLINDYLNEISKLIYELDLSFEK